MTKAIRLYLVRHGEAAAAWDKDLDPGLSPLGHEQAVGAADRFTERQPLALYSSPLQRARETAVPFEGMWGRKAIIEPSVTEIPSPGHAPDERGPWLWKIMHGTWAEAADPILDAWRQKLVDALLTMTESALITTHFIAINVAVGAATGNDKVVGFRPDNASCTIIDVADGKLHLVELGVEAKTKVG